MTDVKPETIDFYLLAPPDEPDLVACRLVEKAFRQDHAVLIWCPERERRERLDERLWTFRGGSFIPHALLEPGAPLPERLLPGDLRVWLCAELPEDLSRLAAVFSGGLVLLNLAPQPPTSLAGLTRLLELVPADDGERTAARERARHYRALGCGLAQHRLDAPG